VTTTPGVPNLNQNSQESDTSFFRHIRKIHKYLVALERGQKKKGKASDAPDQKFFSDCLDPLSKYVKQNFLSDDESSRGSMITTMTSNFSDLSVLRAHSLTKIKTKTKEDINKGSVILQNVADKKFSLSNAFQHSFGNPDEENRLRGGRP